MDQSLTHVFGRLDRTRAELCAAIETVPVLSRDRRPGPDRWSVAEIVEHLALVDERYTDIVGGAIREVRSLGSVAEAPSVEALPAHVETGLADRSEKRNAPDPVRPTSLAFDAAWARAVEARTAFRALMAGAEGLALHQAVYAHPRFGTLNAYQWVEFLAAHERRHVEQVLETAAQLHDS